MAESSARDIAQWLIWFANEHGDMMTNLRLQKLLYYTQAWHLALNDVPMFDDDFQAWIHGPVIPKIYGEYKKFGSSPIPYAVLIGGAECLPEPQLSSVAREHVVDVMDSYGDMTAWQLERLSHSELPWLEARQGLPPDAACSRTISKNTMRTYFKERLKGA